MTRRPLYPRRDKMRENLGYTVTGVFLGGFWWACYELSFYI